MSHYERRISTLESELRECKEQRRKGLDEVIIYYYYYYYYFSLSSSPSLFFVSPCTVNCHFCRFVPPPYIWDLPKNLVRIYVCSLLLVKTCQEVLLHSTCAAIHMALNGQIILRPLLKKTTRSHTQPRLSPEILASANSPCVIGPCVNSPDVIGPCVNSPGVIGPCVIGPFVCCSDWSTAGKGAGESAVHPRSPRDLEVRAASSWWDHTELEAGCPQPPGKERCRCSWGSLDWIWLVDLLRFKQKIIVCVWLVCFGLGVLWNVLRFLPLYDCFSRQIILQVTTPCLLTSSVSPK